jgi:hypothetical protein
MPEAMYIALMPSATLTVLAGAALLAPSPSAWMIAACGGIIVTALVWAPIAKLTYDAIGLAVPVVTTTTAALLLQSLLPLMRVLNATLCARAAAASLTLGVLCATWARLAPLHSEEVRSRINLAHFTHLESRETSWLTDASRLPSELASAAQFRKAHVPPSVTWGLLAQFRAPAPAADIAPPSVETLSTVVLPGDTRAIELLLIPGASALALTLAVPSRRVTDVRIEGQRALARALSSADVYTLIAPRAAGIRLTLRIEGAELVHAELAQHTRGLPPAGRPLARARDQIGTESQNGDLTIVSRKVAF